MALLVFVGCRELEPIAANQCGNGAIEPGEDCDVIIDPSLGLDTTCAPPGAAAACHYVCARSPCPNGWGCGDDGTCRHGIGQWSPPIATLPLEANTWGTGDADGDGAHELIAVTASGIAVVHDLGASVSLATGGGPTGTSAIADLDGDHVVDLVVPQAAGLVVAFGGPEIVPSAYAPFTAPARNLWLAGIRLPGVGPEHGLLSIAGSASPLAARVARIPDANDNSGDWPIEMTGDELGEHFARLDVDAPSDADEIVIAGGGVARLLWVGPDVFQPSRLGVYERAIGLPLPATGGALLADRDGDGDQDVLIRLGDRVGIAYDSGVTLDDAMLDPAFERLAEPGDAVPGLPEVLQTWPLAAGDLDGDGVADFVSPNGIFLTVSGGALERVTRRANPTPWHDAVIADLDGDGRRDVVAADGASLIVLRNASAAGPPQFAQQVLPISCTPSRLRVLDFDGLRGDDIVYRARGAGCARPHLGALYGGPGPFAAVAVIALDVDRFEPGRFRDSRGILDGPDDIVAVAAQQPGLAFRSLGFIGGALDRHPVAPLTLSRFPGSVDVADSVVAGRFGAFDLAAIIAAPTPRLYLAASRPTLDPRPRPHEWAAVGLHGIDPHCMRWLSGDLDGNGVDELVGVPLACAPAALAVSIDLTGIPRATRWPLDVVREALLEDLDGDGCPDLVTVGATSGIHWCADPARRNELPRGIAVATVQADRDAARELAILLDDQLIVLDVVGGTPVVLTSHAIIASDGRLLIADLDHDGVDDLVVTRSTGAELHRGITAETSP